MAMCDKDREPTHTADRRSQVSSVKVRMICGAWGRQVVGKQSVAGGGSRQMSIMGSRTLGNWLITMLNGGISTMTLSRE